MADGTGGGVAIFIDGGYLDKVLKIEHEGAKVDLDKLATEMAMGLPRYRAYYYHCPRWMPGHPTAQERATQSSQDRFFERVRKLPRFEVRLGRLKCRGKDENHVPVFEQKGVDILLAIDIMRVAQHRTASVVALLAGDGDYAPLVQAVKDSGQVVRLFHGQGEDPRCKFAQDLWTACDERFPIDMALVQKVRR